MERFTDTQKRWERGDATRPDPLKRVTTNETSHPMTPDYTAATTTASLFDTSAAGKLLLTGPDAPMFLGNLCTNDTKNLPLGGGCEAYFCDSRAKVQFAAWVYHVVLADQRHAMPDLPEFAHMERTFGANATCDIRRRDQLGLPGFDIVCRAELADGVRA